MLTKIQNSQFWWAKIGTVKRFPKIRIMTRIAVCVWM